MRVKNSSKIAGHGKRRFFGGLSEPNMSDVADMRENIEGHVARLQLIGAFSITDHRGRALPSLPKKSRALLAMLALSPTRALPRSTLAASLWQLSDTSHAEASFRQGLSVLSKSLAPLYQDWLIKSGEGLQLNPSYFKTDVLELRHHLETSDFETLKGSVDGSSNEFLEGMRFAEPVLQNWLLQERATVRVLLGTAIMKLIAHAETISDWSSVLRYGRKLTDIDPIDERGHHAAIKSLMQQGMQAEALAQYQTCCAHLAEHAISEPAHQIKQLIKSLQSNQDKAHTSGADEPPSGSLGPQQDPSGPTIAVMPFASNSHDASEKIIAKAVPQTLVQELRRFLSFSVISSSSTQSMEDWKSDVVATVAPLRADYLISGSVMQHRGRIQLSVELLKARNGAVVWAEHFHCDAGDVFAVQIELARSIAGAIEPSAMMDIAQSSGRSSMQTLSQWEVLARGTQELFRQVGSGWQNRCAQDHFEHALVRDQDCATAYAGLAYAYCLNVKENMLGASEMTLRRALEMANHAVSLSQYDPWCHLVRGRVLQQMGNHHDGISSFETAIRLCPSSSKAHFGLGMGLTAMGHLSEAEVALDEALRLSPNDPMAWSFLTVRTLSALYREDFEAADQTARQARSMPNASHWAQVMHIPALINLGRTGEAEILSTHVREAKSDLSIAMVRRAFPSQLSDLDLPLSQGLRRAGIPK